MAKRAVRRAGVEQQPAGNPSITSRLLSGSLLWQIVCAGFGALVAISFLMPVDAISVFAGSALPQNLGWLTLAIFASAAAAVTKDPLRLSKLETICLTLGLLWLIGCTWLLSNANDGRAVWNSFWQLLSLGSCFYIGRALFQSARVRSAALLVILVGCSGVAMDGLQQVFLSLPATRRAYEADPERVLAENDIQAPLGSPRRKQFEDRLYSPEPFATFALANSLGTLLSCGVVLTGGWLIALNRMRRLKVQHGGTTKFGLQIALGGLAVAMFVQLTCLLLTRSRAGYLALLFALGFGAVLQLLRQREHFRLRQIRLAGVLAGGLVIGATVWLLAFDRRVLSEATKSLGYRVEYWQATLSMIGDHALTGVGLGNFQAYYPRYKLEQASEVIADPHNWILDIAASLSVPSALLIVSWFVITVAIGSWVSLVKKGSTTDATQEPAANDALAETVCATRLLQGALYGSGVAILFMALIGSIELKAIAIEWAVAVALGLIAWRTLFPLTLAKQSPAPTRLDLAWCVAGLCAIAVAQLVSGSWQASGIAIPFLILSASVWGTALTAPAFVNAETNTTPGEAAARNLLSFPPLLLALVGAAVFGFQAWRPVMQSWMLATQADRGATLSQQEALIAEAVAADPLNRSYLLQHAMILGAQAAAADDAAAFVKRAEIALDKVREATRLDTTGSVTSKLAGQLSLDLAAAADRLGVPKTDYLTAAQGFYSNALSRYPSSVELTVQNSVVAAAIGDWKTAKAMAESAIELSRRIPHDDKQLETQVVWLPIDLPGLDRTSMASESGGNWSRAEPLISWIRNHIE